MTAQTIVALARIRTMAQTVLGFISFLHHDALTD